LLFAKIREKRENHRVNRNGRHPSFVRRGAF
jgi:hypothetical protein